MRQLLLVALLCSFSTSAFAAELSLLAGYRVGGPSVEVPVILCLSLDCQQPSIEARDGEALGLILDLPFRDRLMFEILLSHQTADFDGQDLVALEIYPPPGPSRFDLTYLHFGVLRRWEKTRVSPFAAVGIGIAQLEADRAPFFFDTIDEDRLSASLAGGIKVDLNQWLGVRVEGRGYWADMPGSVGEDLFQLELSSGLTFRL